MDAQYYSFMLDFIPLTDCVHEQNPTFADVLQRTALDAIMLSGGRRADPCATGRLLALLRLSCDLGYIDADVLHYLDAQLRRAAGDGPCNGAGG